MTNRISIAAVIFLVGCGADRPFEECVGDACGGGPVCGNDDREAGEECDTTDLDGNLCATLGFDAGLLVCKHDCTFDTTACCMDNCEPHRASRCDGDRIESCEPAAGQCLDWVTAGDCSLSGSTCVESGAASCEGSGCSDSCTTVNQTRCTGETVELCGPGSDGCNSWLVTADCGGLTPAKICDDSSEPAQCLLDCADSCPGLGNTRCNANVVESCDLSGQGCLAWEAIDDCAAAGQLCDEGTGTPICASVCTDGCTPADTKRCLGNLLQNCATQPSGCLGWQSDTDCAVAGQICEEIPAPAVCVDTVTTIRVHFDTGFGNRITLRGIGAGLSWAAGVDCVWADGNIWECPMPGLLPGDELKPLVNDEIWAPGTNYLIAAPGNMEIFPFFYGSVGRIETWDNYHSTTLGNDRTVLIYLPVSYDENLAKSYPVILMHDGQNVFDSSTSFLGIEWQVDEALNNLSTQAGIREAIVVAPYNGGAARTYEYTPTVDDQFGAGGGGDLYLDFLLDELLPDVRTTYRTEGARVGLAGSSFGGVITMYGCWTRPADFDLCGVFSPALWWDNGMLLDLVANHTGPKPDLKIYLDSGDSGPAQDGMALTADMRDLLIGQGYTLGDDLKYVLGEGHEHNEAAWALRTPAAMEYLLDDPQRVDP